MIIVKLFGGLGNQMFQYAAGRRLAYFHNTELKFDFQGLNYKIKRNYALNTFNINEKCARNREISKLKFKKRNLLKKIVGKIFDIPPELSSAYIKERYFHFDSAILNLPEGVYLDGYWQSEKYFRDIEEIIRKVFAIKIPQTGRNKELAEKIEATKSVSLHIRRGDYISEPKAMLFHGVCGMDYYKKCISIIGRKIEKPYFFIFSDDYQWVYDNFKIDYPMIIVDNNTDCAYEDLRLMSQCKHHIIANSSFSWWGAWLNPRQDKIVFAPKNWFNSNKVNDKDLIPSEWLRI